MYVYFKPDKIVNKMDGNWINKCKERSRKIIKNDLNLNSLSINMVCDKIELCILIFT